jgi:hypothetical protein
VAPPVEFQEVDDASDDLQWVFSCVVPEEHSFAYEDVAVVDTIICNGQQVVSDVNPAASNVAWNDGSRSWHERDGTYKLRVYDAPNFIAASGAQLWLHGDGTFEDKGSGVRNFINSAGFAMVLTREGGLRETQVTDINGVRMAVTEDGVLNVPYLSRPLVPPVDASELDLQYEFVTPLLRIVTAIVGPLSAPRFLANGDYANLLVFTGADAAPQFHFVTGFPYKALNEWTYADREEGSRISNQLHEVSVHGRIVGRMPTAANWSESCSKYGIMQVGGTCASTACLNLLLNHTALRVYCVKAMNGYLHDDPSIADRWKRPGILQSQSLTETLLNVVYKRLCGRSVSTPDTLFLEGTCVRSQTFLSKLYCTPDGRALDSILLIDILRALGLSAGVIHPPAGIDIPGAYDFALRVTTSVTEALPLELNKFVLSGAYIEGFSKNLETGHAIAGIVCVDGSRVVFDSNIGEVPMDWLLNPAALQLYFEKQYFGKGVTVRQMGLYLSDAFIARHRHSLGAERLCFSSLPSDRLTIAPAVRSLNYFCELATRVSTVSDTYDIQSGSVVRFP